MLWLKKQKDMIKAYYYFMDLQIYAGELLEI